MLTRQQDAAAVVMLPGVIRRTLSWSDEMMLCEIALKKGSAAPLHQHPHQQVGYVVRGLIRMTVGAETEVLRPGDGYAIPGGVPHGAEALEDSVVVDVFHPHREDYRPGAGEGDSLWRQLGDRYVR